MNQIILIGNLTKSPELTTTQNGINVCRFGLAVRRSYPNTDGEYETDFFNIVAWRKLAEHCAKYLEKGRKVAISGSLQMRTYEVEGEKRVTSEVIANDVQFLSPANNDKKEEETSNNYDLDPADESDLPF